MIHVLGLVSIEDLPKFAGFFATRSVRLRRAHGCLGSQMFHVRDDEQRAVLLFAWQSQEAFEGFLADPAVREAMKTGGTTAAPEFTFLTKIGEYPN
jgi:heme-degrading monooxygenase HmoA